MRSLALAVLMAALASFGLAGCATAPDAALQAPLDDGVTHNFPTGYGIVRAAALESVGRLNVSIEGADETPERYQIRFRKLLGGVPWGDVGVVNVMRVDDWTTQVVVNSEQNEKMRRASSRERQFADQVFSNIAESLMRIRQ